MKFVEGKGHHHKFKLIGLCLFVVGLIGCADGVFVKRLPPPTCKPNEFSCQNHKGRIVCLPQSFKCDNRIDCLYGEDEKDCFERPITCLENEFRCDHRQMCIDKRYRCDGTYGDCSDYSDEDNCPGQCNSTGTRAMCYHKIMCLEKPLFCDGIADCLHGVDEFHCFKRKKDYGKETELQCPEDMFRCKNGMQCIQKEYLCDAAIDCADASDEFQCETHRMCKEGDKVCKNGNCMPESKFCDGIEDCTDGSDELHCPLPDHLFNEDECGEKEYKCLGRPTTCISHENLCRTKNAKDDCVRRSVCAQEMKFCDSNDPNCRCRPTYANGTVCYCPNGFKTVGNKCVDIDECKEMVGACDQMCFNLNGSYVCNCGTGYQLYTAKGEGKARKCRVLGENPLLILSNRFEMRQYDLITHRLHSLAENLSSDAVMDYWHKNQTVVWSDSTNGQLIACKTKRLPDGLLTNLEGCVHEGNEKQFKERTQKTARFHGIAVDWVHGLVFWSEITPIPTIKVYDLINGYYRVIIENDIVQPKSIVVDPSAGLLFWTDWSSESRIERAGMNGNDRISILQPPNVKWPTALTLDIIEREVYWADAKLRSIMKSDYYGQNIQTIVHSHVVVKHPFSIVVFEDKIFYADRDLPNILTINRFDGSDIEILFTRLQGPTALRVYQEQLQPDQRNLCANQTCSQLCLPMASMKAKTAEEETTSESGLMSYMCLCSAGQKADPKNPSQCIEIEQSSDDYYIPESRLKRRRSIFSSLSIIVMISMLFGAAYYWWNKKHSQYSNNFQQFINPAFDTN